MSLMRSHRGDTQHLASRLFAFGEHLRSDAKLGAGDTIVEVLIAIAIASFAIGTSYTLANKSLQNAITASDRNQAVNLAENQIVDLKARHQLYGTTGPGNSETVFNDDFGAPSSTPAPGLGQPPTHGRDFCLVDSVTKTVDPGWGPKDNTAIQTDSDADTLANYNSTDCVRLAQYYINITALVTSTSSPSSNNTVFRISVRWPTVGSDTISQATLYYRF
jgi:type II secretory pathway pseudopilin PulG